MDGRAFIFLALFSHLATAAWTHIRKDRNQ